MTSTTFQGPVRTGNETGSQATDTIGTLTAIQRVTVASNTSGASNIVLPTCTITGITVDVLVSASGNAGGMLVNVGTTADATKYASIKGSAAGRYMWGVLPNRSTVSAAAVETIPGPQRIYVDVTAVTSAGNVENFSGILSITYLQR